MLCMTLWPSHPPICTQSFKPQHGYIRGVELTHKSTRVGFDLMALHQGVAVLKSLFFLLFFFLCWCCR